MSPAKFIAQTAPLVPIVERKPPQVWKEHSKGHLNNIILLDESHKEQTWADDYAAFKNDLATWGTLVVHKKRPLTAGHLEGVHLLVIGAPEHPWLFGRSADKWREEEIAAIRDFVSGGGGLLVLGDSMSAPKNLSALTEPFGIRFTKEHVGDVTLKREAIMPYEIVAGVHEIRMGSLRGGAGIALKAETPAFCVIKDEDKVILAAATYGAGMVVAASSLTMFAEPFLHEADNRILLMGLVDTLLHADAVAKSGPSSHGGLTGKAFSTVLAGGDGKPKGEFGRVESMQTLIDIWDQWETAYHAFLEEMDVLQRANFPDDRGLMMDVCARNIRHWQPGLLDLMQEEVVQWQRLKANDGLDETEHRICQAIVVNRALAISQHRQKLELLKHQFEAMEAWDTFAVEDLFLDAEMIDNSQFVLQNEYALLLQDLGARGLSLPEDVIPEPDQLMGSEWYLALFLIDWLLPVDVPGLHEDSEPWVAGWEDWVQAREVVEHVAHENGMKEDAFCYHFQLMNDVNH